MKLGSLLYISIFIVLSNFCAKIHLLSPIDRKFLDYVAASAASGGMSDDLPNLLKNHPEININATTGESGKTALLIAVEKNNQDLVQLLLKYGADPRIPSAGNQTPLQIAEKKGESFIASDIKEALAKFKETKGAQQDLYQAEDKIQEAIKILKTARAKLQEALNAILSELNSLPIDNIKKKELAHNIRKLAEDSALTAVAGYFAFDASQ